MEEDISKYIHERKKCPLCLSENISPPIAPHIDLQFPILPVCVDTPVEEDNFAPFNICICDHCGLILLREIVDPEILYKIFHSDGIGKVWDEHYSKFAELIKKHCPEGKILEIGAGQGKLITKLLQKYSSGIEVIDPLYQGPTDNVKVHRELLNDSVCQGLVEQFDAVVSSHTLEHFIEFNEYFKNAWKILKKDGLLCTSIPNQELGFLRGYGNQLNFEHPSICLNPHWNLLHYQNGFEIKEISFFRDHSIQFVAKKIDKKIEHEVNIKEFSEKVVEQYANSISERIDKIKQFAKPDKENWLFGASNLSQPLFVYGLKEDYFKGVLDNSPLKHNKRLYGTNLICKNPEEIVKKGSDLRIFLNIAHYNKEVFDQIKNLDSS
ncbi:MAG: class I SAM-dependent methyltransferase, partial [Nitrosarchaeum sp.]